MTTLIKQHNHIWLITLHIIVTNLSYISTSSNYYGACARKNLLFQWPYTNSWFYIYNAKHSTWNIGYARTLGIMILNSRLYMNQQWGLNSLVVKLLEGSPWYNEEYCNYCWTAQKTNDLITLKTVMKLNLFIETNWSDISLVKFKNLRK